MKTSKPLVQLIPDILSHIEQWKPNLEFNFRLYKLMEGQIRKEIEDSLAKELISKAAYNRCIQRIPSLNILKRTTDKLSKVYVEAPKRKAQDEMDNELITILSKETNINVIMDVANKFYNGLFSFALEPYIEEDKHKIRVLSPHQFLVYSDSKTDKSKHTVFIKLLGTRVSTVVPFNGPTKDGSRQDTEQRPELVDIFALYSDTEFMIIDSSGSVRKDIMQEMNINSTRNEFGRIPFVYGKRTVTELMPYPNQPGFDFSILIPKLLTDLNYSAQFCSHSITWTKNVKLNNQEYAPDAVIDLGDTESDGADPEIGTITPTVDVQNQLSLIEFQFAAHLDSLGIKANTNGSLSNGRDASGIAKAIDEGDVSSEKKTQTNYFSAIENDLWSLLSDMQNVWTGRDGVKERRVFSSSFKDTFAVEFCEVKILKSFAQKVEEVKGLRDLKLATRAQAIKMLHPDWSKQEVDAWISELNEEAEEQAEMMMEAMSLQPERQSDGTFNEGNQQGAKQTPESRPNEVE
jgi:hypothetical protein